VDLAAYLVVMAEVVVKVQDLVWMDNLALVVVELVDKVVDHQALVVEVVVEWLSFTTSLDK
tara:strand:+ start:293 stop:475 length:183 start_codon:yes stop_codon:yes gene_type:complete